MPTLYRQSETGPVDCVPARGAPSVSLYLTARHVVVEVLTKGDIVY